MGKPKAPKAPDPVATASAQTGLNIGTAVANSYLNNVNQVTPDGSLSFGQSGTKKWTDPVSGKSYDIPQFTATQSLSPAGQQVKSLSDQADINLAGLARDQSGRLGSLLSAPVNINNEATEARLMELGRARLDPALDRQRNDLQTQLSNQGIKLGSAAHDRAMGNFGEQSNDAYNQLLLTGRGQSVQEALAERNQPINEITALLSGSQVSQPQFVNAGQSQIPTTDFAGITQQDYQNQMGAYGQKMSGRNAMMGGLFSLGAAGIGAI